MLCCIFMVFFVCCSILRAHKTAFASSRVLPPSIANTAKNSLTSKQPYVVDSPRTILHILPYPDIPGNFRLMLDIIRKDFERENPDIALSFTQPTVSDAYKIDKLTNWLSAPVPENTERPTEPVKTPQPDTGVDLAEIDTMMLGALVARGVVDMPLITAGDWHPAAVKASSVNGTLYGVPHWMCGNFIISKDKKLTETTNIRQLTTAIKQTKKKPPYLAGNYAGSAFFVLNYVQAWAENASRPHNLQTALDTPLDIHTISTIRAAAKLCEESGENPCLDEYYHDNPNVYISRTVNGEYAALMGFSEVMWHLACAGANPKEWYIGAMPFGNSSENVLLADSYVMRKGLSAQKKRAIKRFLRYVMRDTVYSKIMLSGGDCFSALPRYIIPARPSVLDLPEIKADTYYRRIGRQVSRTLSYPNWDVPVARERIYQVAMPLLKGTASPLPLPQNHAQAFAGI